jgi:hypothetical protein
MNILQMQTSNKFAKLTRRNNEIMKGDFRQ